MAASDHSQNTLEKFILDIDFNVKMNKNVASLLITHCNGYVLSYSKILSSIFIELLLGSPL